MHRYTVLVFLFLTYFTLYNSFEKQYFWNSTSFITANTYLVYFSLLCTRRCSKTFM